MVNARCMAGWGALFGADTGTGRGAHKAKSVVPAICVDASVISGLWSTP